MFKAARVINSRCGPLGCIIPQCSTATPPPIWSPEMRARKDSLAADGFLSMSYTFRPKYHKGTGSQGNERLETRKSPLRIFRRSLLQTRPRSRSARTGPYSRGALTTTVESMLAIVGRAHLAMVISISSRRISNTRTTPCSPSTARPQNNGRPMQTALAPRAKAFTTSAPRRMPPSSRTSSLPLAAATASERTSIVARVLSRCRPVHIPRRLRRS
jgi:hypothetical protein